MSGQFSNNNENTVGRFADDLEWDRPKKGKLRIMPVSDSAFAPTGFGSAPLSLSSRTICERPAEEVSAFAFTKLPSLF